MEQVATMNTLKAKRDQPRQKEEERRRSLRNHLMLGVKGGATAEKANGTPLEFHGHTTDVSLRGLCILADRNPGISIGQQFKVVIQLFQNEAPIEALGQVCWFKEADQAGGEQSTQIGFELLGMANSTRDYDRWIERINWN
jgi:hypothetical protein